MTDSTHINSLLSAIEDLQSRLAFQEDTIEQLSQALAAQDQEIIRLSKKQQQFNELLEQLESGADAGPAPTLSDEVPPHY